MIVMWTGLARHGMLWLATAWLAVSAATIKHNHMHRRTFRAAWANRLLEHTLGKLDRHQHRDRDTIRRDPTAVE